MSWWSSTLHQGCRPLLNFSKGLGKVHSFTRDKLRWPPKSCLPKREVVLQPFIFSGAMLHSRNINSSWWFQRISKNMRQIANLHPRKQGWKNIPHIWHHHLEKWLNKQPVFHPPTLQESFKSWFQLHGDQLSPNSRIFGSLHRWNKEKPLRTCLIHPLIFNNRSFPLAVVSFGSFFFLSSPRDSWKHPFHHCNWDGSDFKQVGDSPHDWP